MILAFGDSHRSRKALEQMAVIILREKAKYFVHTGDNYCDFQWLKKNTKVPGNGVRGNCDLALIPGAREELILEYKEKRIFLTHGHSYGVKYTLSALVERARELAVDAVIFGHSHVQLAEIQDGTWLINPGSISLPRGGSRPGYCRISVYSGEIKAELIQV